MLFESLQCNNNTCSNSQTLQKLNDHNYSHFARPCKKVLNDIKIAVYEM